MQRIPLLAFNFVHPLPELVDKHLLFLLQCVLQIDLLPAQLWTAGTKHRGPRTLKIFLVTNLTQTRLEHTSFATYAIKPYTPYRKQLKEAETMYYSKNLRKLMGVLWAHTGAIGCIMLKKHVLKYNA